MDTVLAQTQNKSLEVKQSSDDIRTAAGAANITAEHMEMYGRVASGIKAHSQRLERIANAMDTLQASVQPVTVAVARERVNMEKYVSIRTEDIEALLHAISNVLVQS